MGVMSTRARPQAVGRALRQLAEQAHCSAAVATGLNEDLYHVPVLINGPSKVLPLAIDRDKDFVQEPRIAETAQSPFQSPCVLGTELPVPSLVGHPDSSFGQQILDIPEADAESVVAPDCVADDVGRKPVSVERSAAFHPAILAGIGSS